MELLGWAHRREILHSFYGPTQGWHEDYYEQEKNKPPYRVGGEGDAHAEDGRECANFDVAHLSGADGQTLGAKDAAVEAGWAAGEENAALHCGEAALEDPHGDEDEEREEEPGGEGEGEEEDGHAEAAAQEDSAADSDAASQQSHEEGAENEADAVGGG